MSSATASSGRDVRILAGYRAEATIPELCLAEEVARGAAHRTKTQGKVRSRLDISVQSVAKGLQLGSPRPGRAKEAW